MVKVLQVELFERDIPSTVSLMLDRCQAAEKQNLLISASGAHGLVTAAQDAQFRLILQSFFINLPDGMPSVWVGRLKGTQRMQRCYGPDFYGRSCWLAHHIQFIIIFVVEEKVYVKSIVITQHNRHCERAFFATEAISNPAGRWLRFARHDRCRSRDGFTN